MKHINGLVIGGLGQLGRAIHDYREDHIDFLKDIEFKYIDIHESVDYPWVEVLDALNVEDIKNYINKQSINFIINCAAYTDVNKAEEGNTLVYTLNAKLPEQLAIICRDLNIPLIHISTDYVYGGNRNIPFVEDDPNYLLPDTIYGVTKLKGEKLVRKNTKDYIILRTSWLYYKYSPTSFPSKIAAKLNNETGNIYVVDDQIGTPTYALHLAKAIVDIIYNNRNGFRVPDSYSEIFDRSGVYNFSDMGVCSWYDFALEVEKLMYNNGPYSQIWPCSTPTDDNVKRPKYSVMNKDKFNKAFPYYGFMHWTWGLQEMICGKKYI